MKKFTNFEDESKKKDYKTKVNITTKSGLVIEGETITKDYGVSYVKENLTKAFEDFGDIAEVETTDIAEIPEEIDEVPEKLPEIKNYEIGDEITFYTFNKDDVDEPVIAKGVIQNITSLKDFYLVTVTETPEESFTTVGTNIPVHKDLIIE
jgi:hypothetical protein